MSLAGLVQTWAHEAFRHTGGGMGELTRWNVTVSKETDISLRSYLAHGKQRGGHGLGPVRLRRVWRASEA